MNHSIFISPPQLLAGIAPPVIVSFPAVFASAPSSLGSDVIIRRNPQRTPSQSQAQAQARARPVYRTPQYALYTAPLAYMFYHNIHNDIPVLSRTLYTQQTQ